MGNSELVIPAFREFLEEAERAFKLLAQRFDFESERSVHGREASFLLTKKQRLNLRVFFEPFTSPWLEVVGVRRQGLVVRTTFERLLGESQRASTPLRLTDPDNPDRAGFKVLLTAWAQVFADSFEGLLNAEEGVGDMLAALRDRGGQLPLSLPEGGEVPGE